MLPLFGPYVYHFFFRLFIFVDFMHIVVRIQHQQKLVEVILLEELPLGNADRLRDGNQLLEPVFCVGSLPSIGVTSPDTSAKKSVMSFICQ